MNMPWLVEGFIRHFSNSVEMMAGEKPSLTSNPGATPPAGVVIWEQSFNVEGAKAWLAGEASAWIAPGALLLKAAGIDDADEETAKGTFQETLSQAFSSIASDITARLKAEVTAGPAAEVTTVPDGLGWTGLELEMAGMEPAKLYLGFSSSLEALLEKPSAPPPESRAQSLARQTAATVAAAGAEGSRTLELLLDVELPVSVSFGRAQLPLKDVIKLTTGSIVELNRTVGEPVEVIVNNCVIARGEVVVVEGNFGVRVQQVISRQERLRTLY